TETGTATGDVVNFSTLPGPVAPSALIVPLPSSPSAPVSVAPSPQPPGKPRSQILCAGVGDPPLRIPTGYVPVAFLHAQPGCGADRYGYRFNAEEIQKAANGVDACVGNGINPGIPNGFVVTKMWHKAGCGNDRYPYGFNTDEIREAANGVDACVGNNISNPGIPSGFVVTKMWHKAGCGNDRYPYGFNADEIHKAATGVDACVGNGITNPIPDGFTVIRRVTKSGCGPAGRGYNALEIGAA